MTLFGLNRPKPVFLVKSQFYWPEVTKTTFLGQIWPKQVFPANIDQNHIVQAENRKMKIVKLRPKNGRGGGKPQGLKGKKRKFWIFLCQLVKKKFGLEKKCQRSRMTRLNLWPRTVSQNGNIPRRHAKGPRFESRRDQYLYWRNQTQFLSPHEPKWAQMSPKLVFSVKTQFFRPKSTKTMFFG